MGCAYSEYESRVADKCADEITPPHCEIIEATIDHPSRFYKTILEPRIRNTAIRNFHASNDILFLPDPLFSNEELKAELKIKKTISNLCGSYCTEIRTVRASFNVEPLLEYELLYENGEWVDMRGNILWSMRGAIY